MEEPAALPTDTTPTEAASVANGLDKEAWFHNWTSIASSMLIGTALVAACLSAFLTSDRKCSDLPTTHCGSHGSNG
jgi:hypothetical protein